MKLVTNIFILAWSVICGVLADPVSDSGAALNLPDRQETADDAKDGKAEHAEVDALVKAKRAEDAADLLQKIIKDNPSDFIAFRKLGSLYTLVLKQPEKGAPLLEKGFKLGDKKCLVPLAMAQMVTKDHKGMLAYKKSYVENYEELSGSRIICFYIAGLENDQELFQKLIRRTPAEDIEKDKNLSGIIARTVKFLAEANR